MKKIANLLFEAKILKEIPRSGYHFLGVGKESVAEHSFCTTFIAYVMSQMEPGIDALKLISMCLLHDLAEARIGDLNTVHKKYVIADESAALEDTFRGLPFGRNMMELVREYNDGSSPEAELDTPVCRCYCNLRMFRDWFPDILPFRRTAEDVCLESESRSDRKAYPCNKVTVSTLIDEIE